jgi:hypothetical protein
MNKKGLTVKINSIYSYKTLLEKHGYNHLLEPSVELYCTWTEKPILFAVSEKCWLFSIQYTVICLLFMCRMDLASP